MRDGPIGPELDQLQVGLQGEIGVPLGREVIGVDPQGVGVKRIAQQDSTEEIQLEVELRLSTLPAAVENKLEQAA